MGCAGGWRCSSVTCTNSPGVGHLCSSERALTTAAKKVDSHLDASATDLHFWRIGVGHKVISKLHASVQGSLASAIPKDCLTLNIGLLIDVQLVLDQGCRCSREERDNNQNGVHD